MNPKLASLQPYPFEKLKTLFESVTVNESLPLISLTIGEPKHPAPQAVIDEWKNSSEFLENYPTTIGLPELRQCISQWLINRFSLDSISADNQILPVNGTREALFAITQTLFNQDKKDQPYIISPNPFYQIYEGAAILAGATPYFIDCNKEQHFLADIDGVSDDVWQQTQMIFLCSPGNPTGAVIPKHQLEKLLALSDKFDFVIVSDECYSEIYFDEKPIGLLEVCQQIGRTDYKNALVFHSLSKRSNVPGLRSGFVAGDATIIEKFKLYRTYHGCAMSIPNQKASIVAWNDEQHVQENLKKYQEKFNTFFEILGDDLNLTMPDASFYFWAPTPVDDKEFAKALYEQQNVKVLPGQYLSRTVNGVNPGQNYVRMALVATVEECTQAALRIKQFIKDNYS